MSYYATDFSILVCTQLKQQEQPKHE